MFRDTGSSSEEQNKDQMLPLYQKAWERYDTLMLRHGNEARKHPKFLQEFLSVPYHHQSQSVLMDCYRDVLNAYGTLISRANGDIAHYSADPQGIHEYRMTQENGQEGTLEESGVRHISYRQVLRFLGWDGRRPFSQVVGRNDSPSQETDRMRLEVIEKMLIPYFEGIGELRNLDIRQFLADEISQSAAHGDSE